MYSKHKGSGLEKAGRWYEIFRKCSQKVAILKNLPFRADIIMKAVVGVQR